MVNVMVITEEEIRESRFYTCGALKVWVAFLASGVYVGYIDCPKYDEAGAAKFVFSEAFEVNDKFGEKPKSNKAYRAAVKQAISERLFLQIEMCLWEVDELNDFVVSEDFTEFDQFTNEELFGIFEFAKVAKFQAGFPLSGSRAKFNNDSEDFLRQLIGIVFEFTKDDFSRGLTEEEHEAVTEINEDLDNNELVDIKDCIDEIIELLNTMIPGCYKFSDNDEKDDVWGVWDR